MNTNTQQPEAVEVAKLEMLQEIQILVASITDMEQREQFMSLINKVAEEKRDLEEKNQYLANRGKETEEENGDMKTRILELQTKAEEVKLETVKKETFLTARITDMEQKERWYIHQINQVAGEKRDLKERNQYLVNRVKETEENTDLNNRLLELQSENNRLSEQERSLTAKAEEVKVETVKKEMFLVSKINDLEQMVKGFISQIHKVEEEKRDLDTRIMILADRVTEQEEEEEENGDVQTRILELTTQNKRLLKQEMLLTTRAYKLKVRNREKERALEAKISELEEEKTELELVISWKKRGFLSRILRGESEEEETLRRRLKAKKKEVKKLKGGQSIKEKEEEEEKEEDAR